MALVKAVPLFPAHRLGVLRNRAVAKTPIKPPSKIELSKAGEGLRNPRDLSRKEVQSLAGRVLREGKKK